MFKFLVCISLVCKVVMLIPFGIRRSPQEKYSAVFFVVLGNLEASQSLQNQKNQ